MCCESGASDQRAAARAHGFVSGVVQGVCFRHFTKLEARRLGLFGWVRNLTDGRVEFVAEGPREQIERLVGWLHEGPSRAQVTRVEVDWGEPTGGFGGFGVRR